MSFCDLTFGRPEDLYLLVQRRRRFSVARLDLFWQGPGRIPFDPEDFQHR
jgi:uncharacterized protein YfkK (UPF0435 family)